MYLELGGFESLSRYFTKTHISSPKARVLEQSLVSIMLNILIVDPNGGRGVSTPGEWMSLAKESRELIGPEPYKTMDEKITFAVFATFTCIVLNRFDMYDAELVDFVCGFIGFGIRVCARKDEAWIEVEELWYLTVQVFSAGCKGGVAGRVDKSGFVEEWNELIKKDIGKSCYLVN